MKAGLKKSRDDTDSGKKCQDKKSVCFLASNLTPAYSFRDMVDVSVGVAQEEGHRSDVPDRLPAVLVNIF